MNSFERDIQNYNQLQKSIVESLTGQNEYQDIVDCLVKAGVAEEDMIEKAKYIRREGSKGNYKYIYEEPQNGNKGEQIKEGDKITLNLPTVSKKELKIKQIGTSSVKLEDNEGNIRSMFHHEFEKYSKKKLPQFNSASGRVTQSQPEYNPKQPEKKEQFVGSGDYKTKKENLPKELKDAKSVLTAKAFLENKYGKGFKGSQLTDEELDIFQDIKQKEKEGFYNYKSITSNLQKAEQTEDQKAKISKVMKEFKFGKLKSSSGEVVTDKSQAIAIAMSEAGISNK